MFIINNLFNCLVFGEQLTHSGHNYRGNYSWWTSLFIFLSFVIAEFSLISVIVLTYVRPDVKGAIKDARKKVKEIRKSQVNKSDLKEQKKEVAVPKKAKVEKKPKKKKKSPTKKRT